MRVVSVGVWITTSGRPYNNFSTHVGKAVHSYMQENANTDKKPTLIGVANASDWCDEITEQCHDVSTVAQQVRCRLFFPIRQRPIHRPMWLLVVFKRKFPVINRGF